MSKYTHTVANKRTQRKIGDRVKVKAYSDGQIYAGTITKINSFGSFYVYTDVPKHTGWYGENAIQ